MTTTTITTTNLKADDLDDEARAVLARCTGIS